MGRFVDDLACVNNLLTDTLLSSIQQAAVLLIGLFAVFSIHARLAFVSACLLPALLAVNLRYGPRLRAQATLAQEKRARAIEILNEAVSSVLLTKVFARERWQLLRLFHKRKEAIRVEIDNYATTARATVAVSLIGGLGPLIVLSYGGYEIMHGRLTLGQLVGFNSVLAYLHGPTQSLAGIFLGAQRALASLDRIAEFIEMEPEEGVRSCGQVLADCAKTGPTIQFEDVHFGYDPSNPVLAGVSVEIPAGAIAAIVGGSGAGKSSLVGLLFRLYEPGSGRITLDGIDIRDYDLQSLRRSIGLVSQDTPLLTGTVLENIRFGRPHAPRAEVIEAAALAHADDFIRRLPEGYETQLGREGHALSAGERQRIALARAVLSQPRILVMDEATSSIDSQSEELMWLALSKFARNRTTIIISHRLSSVLKADMLVHLSGGQVINVGAHERLMQSRIYQELYGQQLSACR
jgi:subfamily B ATP-binding cassette protein MsbA